MKTASYSYDPNIGLPIDDLRGGITLVDDAVHVKVWKDSRTGKVTVCVVPMNGEIEPVVVRQVPVAVVGLTGGTYPAHYTAISPTEKPPRKYSVFGGKEMHGHDFQHVAVAERSPSNWCGICKDWFAPDFTAAYAR
jgi:hypothetical protein